MKLPLTHKAYLFTHTLPVLKVQSAYFSIDAVKRTLTADGIELADNSLRKYMSEAMATGIVVDAGRGWYSRHSRPVSLDPKPVANVIRDVKKVFPLLDFCCWSTVQFNPFALHLIAQPTTFLYAESDTLNSVADALRGIGWNAWANPVKNVVDQLLQPSEKTIVLRPTKTDQPNAKEHIAAIEKALVDLVIEANKLKLMDSAEVQRIIDTALGSGLLQLTVLFGYAEDLKKKIDSKEIIH
ncbi:DUF6577 family protein [Trichlorobacter lovleyi]|uniref:Uncharacterized protein n=1 Tax=Trichlorobacter lovleyi (strain ATCC BAA-1151 / DSM 17278 / SZ) TaxID=398767 RepID=B3E892_TRIL1|nr:DUF6577 family protein [Trichlorobacter lovleyi]ACD95129.1 hypothetical protein Glov_1408 [Trichlorobacter lovleyi SZ]